MKFKEGTDIFTADGEKVGEVSHLVVDPRTQEISHILIKQGFIFKKTRVLPVEWVESATLDAVRLRDVSEDLDALPHYEETHYVSELSKREDEEIPQQTLYWYPPQHATWRWPAGYSDPPDHIKHLNPPATPSYVVQADKAIPEGAVVLEEGMKVVDKFDDRVGDVDHVLTDDTGEHVTHLVISRGFLLTTEKLVPTTWVRKVQSDIVQLAVTGKLIESLPEYEPPTA